jgi:hypothetical protein
MEGRAYVGSGSKLARVVEAGLIAARAATLDTRCREPDRPPLWTPI